MTEQQTEALGKTIGRVLLLAVDILAGYLMGHHFHSFIVGYVTYAVLTSLDSQVIKLMDIRELLKGGR